MLLQVSLPRRLEHGVACVLVGQSALSAKITYSQGSPKVVDVFMTKATTGNIAMRSGAKSLLNTERGKA